MNWERFGWGLFVTGLLLVGLVALVEAYRSVARFLAGFNPWSVVIWITQNPLDGMMLAGVLLIVAGWIVALFVAEVAQ